jgi:hypothetical protein
MFFVLRHKETQMNEIQNSIKGLRLGEIEFYKNMAVAPLIGDSSNLDYIVLDDALKSGLVISETGSVPFLRFTNKTGKEVLILQGEYVTGGKQNRMVATNIYMAQGFDGDVPVRCVEHGRWSGNYQPSLRSSGRMAVKSVCFAAAVGQQEVWDQVNCLTALHDVRTSTQNLGDVYEQKQRDTGEYLDRFGYQSGRGIVSVMDVKGKKIFGIDLFDKNSTMEKHFRKIVESYALEATVGKDNLNVSKQEIADFIENIRNADFSERKAISLGRDYAISGKTIEGFALSYSDLALYTTFTNRRTDKPYVNPPVFIPHPEPWNPHPFPHPFEPHIPDIQFDCLVRTGWKEKFK